MELSLKEILQDYGIWDYATIVHGFTPKEFCDPPIECVRMIWRLEGPSRSFIITCFPSRDSCKIMTADLAGNSRQVHQFLYYSPEKFQSAFQQVLTDLGWSIYDFLGDENSKRTIHPINS